MVLRPQFTVVVGGRRRHRDLEVTDSREDANPKRKLAEAGGRIIEPLHSHASLDTNSSSPIMSTFDTRV